MNFKPSPDYRRIDAVLKRTGIPDRVPLFEIYSNIQEEILSIVYEPNNEIEKLFKQMKPQDEIYKNHIRYMYTLGYDYINIVPDNFLFPLKKRQSTMTNEGERAYVNSESTTITSWKDFESYKWPDMSKVDYSRFDRSIKFIPEGMQVIAWNSGILEIVMWLLGYEGISYLLYDNEPLVAATFEAVGQRMVEYYTNLASFDCVGAIAMGEDMGFNTALMLSPEIYRKYLFPYHIKLVDNVHKYRKPAILHACGNLAEIMEDIIKCGWDAKHSFEDSIEPVWETKKKYGDRLALLGGFDMHKLATMSEEEVKIHTRFMINTCAAEGGWAMGTGNSVPKYIPTRNFLAMVEETLQCFDNINQTISI